MGKLVGKAMEKNIKNVNNMTTGNFVAILFIQNKTEN